MLAINSPASFANSSTAAAFNSPPSPSRPVILVSQASRDTEGGHHQERKSVLFEVSTNFETTPVVTTILPEDVEEEEEDSAMQVSDHDSNEANDQDSAKTRRLTLMWNEAPAVARRGKNLDLDHWTNGAMAATNQDEGAPTFQLPEGITKDDILVTIDIDDEARSSLRADTYDEESAAHITGAISNHPRRYRDAAMSHRCNTDTISNMSSRNTSFNAASTMASSTQFSSSAASTRSLQHRDFEESVRQGILDDLKSIYTATPETAKLVLCIVICVLSDGSKENTYWSGGRVGLAELALNWRLFGADDLKVYEGGLTVQRKDFGFGPLELSEDEGEFYLVNHLAPRAANDIVRRIGGVNEDFMAEI